MSTGSSTGARVARGFGVGVAALLTVGLLSALLYSFANFEDLKTTVPTLDQVQRQQDDTTALRTEADSAVAFAEDMNRPPRSNGNGPGYVITHRNPLGGHDAHWCAADPIGYRIDFTGALLAGSTRDKEQSRWEEAFSDWTAASGGRYRFEYVGEGTFPVTRGDQSTYPIDPQLVPMGEIAISYAVPPAQEGARWDGYRHPAMSGALGIAGTGPVDWNGATDAGLITRGMVVLDAIDSQTDRHDVPVPYVHEAGHALGLSHVEDPGQLMATGAGSGSVMAAGDRRGISLLADLPCD